MAQYKTKQGVSKSFNTCKRSMYIQKLRNGCQLSGGEAVSYYTSSVGGPGATVTAANTGGGGPGTTAANMGAGGATYMILKEK